MNPKVSIIIPCFNGEKYLAKCLDSVIKQTYDNLEIIIIDDGSTDSSSQITQEFAKRDNRVLYYHQNNRGQSSARNHGLQLATGEYISFIDADDEIKRSFIEELITPFQKSPKDVSLSVCGMHYKRLKTKSAEDVYISRLRPRRKSESIKAYVLYLLAIDGRMYSSVNKLYHAKIAKSLKFDESINFSEDTNYVLNYLKKSHGEISFILKPLYIYNFGTDGSTINRTATNWHNWQSAYNHLKTWLGPHPTVREQFWLHIVHLRWRISFIRSKHRAKACNML